MKTKLQTQLGMVRASVGVAQSSNHKLVWSGQAPTAFGAAVARIESEYEELTAKAVLAEAAKVGAADAKAAAETGLEETAFILARALAIHLKRTGDLERGAAVKISRSDLVRLRKQELLHKAIGIRDVGLSVLSESGGEEFGITREHVEELSEAITAFTAVMDAPRNRRVNRGTLLREIETAVAELLDLLDDMDGLVLQFRRTAAGRTFIEAWSRARIIVDAPSGPDAPTQSPPAPAPASQQAPQPSALVAPATAR